MLQKFICLIIHSVAQLIHYFHGSRQQLLLLLLLLLRCAGLDAARWSTSAWDVELPDSSNSTSSTATAGRGAVVPGGGGDEEGDRQRRRQDSDPAADGTNDETLPVTKQWAGPAMTTRTRVPATGGTLLRGISRLCTDNCRN